MEFTIPGLPSHIALLCLLKVPRIYHQTLAAVCSAWRRVVRCPDFYQHRRRLGISDAWLVVVSAETLASHLALLYSAYDLTTKQLLFKVKFPPANTRNNNGRPARPPDHYRIVAINECFALLGCPRSVHGHCPEDTISQFTIYNTITNEWRSGAPIGVSRHMFACGVINGNLYVAGGFNAHGEVERSTEVYDFRADRWRTAASLPEQVGLIDADVVFQGKLYLRCRPTSSAGSRSVIGAGNEQRQSACSFWVYDPVHDLWMQETTLSSGSCCGRAAGSAGNLVATEEFMYEVGANENFCRFERSSGGWRLVARCCCSWSSSRSGGAPSTSIRPAAVINSNESAQQRYSSQRAFGYGKDIFLLNEASQPMCQVVDDAGAGFTKCHRLPLGKGSRYHAGSIVDA